MSGLFAKAPAYGKQLAREIYDSSGGRNFAVKPDGDQELYDHNCDLNEWTNPACIPRK